MITSTTRMFASDSALETRDTELANALLESLVRYDYACKVTTYTIQREFEKYSDFRTESTKNKGTLNILTQIYEFKLIYNLLGFAWIRSDTLGYGNCVPFPSESNRIQAYPLLSKHT